MQSAIKYMTYKKPKFKNKAKVKNFRSCEEDRIVVCCTVLSDVPEKVS